MTEAEWLESADSEPMIDFLVGRADEKHLRLFAVECCRRVWHLLPEPQSEFEGAIDLCKRVAQGDPRDPERARLYAAAVSACAAFAAAAANRSDNSDDD